MWPRERKQEQSKQDFNELSEINEASNTWGILTSSSDPTKVAKWIPIVARERTSLCMHTASSGGACIAKVKASGLNCRIDHKEAHSALPDSRRNQARLPCSKRVKRRLKANHSLSVQMKKRKIMSLLSRLE